MLHQVTLSDHSLTLMGQISKQGEVDLADVMAWVRSLPLGLRNPSPLAVESLRTSLIHDIMASVWKDQVTHAKEKKSQTALKLQFVLLAAAGTLLAACEGFDGIAAMLEMLASVPAASVFAVSLAFAVLSVIVFYSFDLVEISKNLGVSVGESRRLIDVYVEQVEQIAALRKKIGKEYLNTQDVDTLDTMKQLCLMLEEREAALNTVREQLSRDVHHPLLQATKLVTALITGLLFFGGGFFAGHSVALALAGFLAASTATVFIPAFSILVGLAAFSTYWFVERPGLQKAIGRWFGLDDASMEILLDTKQADKIQGLTQRIDQRIQEQMKLQEHDQRSQRTTPDFYTSRGMGLFSEGAGSKLPANCRLIRSHSSPQLARMG